MHIVEEIKHDTIVNLSKIVALDDEGNFGLAAMRDGALRFTSPPATMPHIIQAARRILAGDARIATHPGMTLGLAVANLAVAYKLGQVCAALNTVVAENAKLRAALQAEGRGLEALAEAVADPVAAEAPAP